jgi:hypothetical protein
MPTSSRTPSTTPAITTQLRKSDPTSVKSGALVIGVHSGPTGAARPSAPKRGRSVRSPLRRDDGWGSESLANPVRWPRCLRPRESRRRCWPSSGWARRQVRPRGAAAGCRLGRPRARRHRHGRLRPAGHHGRAGPGCCRRRRDGGVRVPPIPQRDPADAGHPSDRGDRPGSRQAHAGERPHRRRRRPRGATVPRLGEHTTRGPGARTFRRDHPGERQRQRAAGRRPRRAVAGRPRLRGHPRGGDRARSTPRLSSCATARGARPAISAWSARASRSTPAAEPQATRRDGDDEVRHGRRCGGGRRDAAPSPSWACRSTSALGLPGREHALGCGDPARGDVLTMYGGRTSRCSTPTPRSRSCWPTGSAGVRPVARRAGRRGDLDRRVRRRPRRPGERGPRQRRRAALTRLRPGSRCRRGDVARCRSPRRWPRR